MQKQHLGLDFGYSQQGDGVYGETNIGGKSGVYGKDNSGNGYGVKGESSHFGVYGVSSFIGLNAYVNPNTLIGNHYAIYAEDLSKDGNGIGIATKGSRYGVYSDASPIIITGSDSVDSVKIMTSRLILKTISKNMSREIYLQTREIISLGVGEVPFGEIFSIYCASGPGNIEKKFLLTINANGNLGIGNIENAGWGLLYHKLVGRWVVLPLHIVLQPVDVVWQLRGLFIVLGDGKKIYNQ